MFFLVLFTFVLAACNGGVPTTWRIDYQNRTAYHPICTICLIPFPAGANATGGSPMTTQTFAVAVKDLNPAELTQFYADALAKDGWAWAPNTDPNKYVAPANNIFVAAKAGHAYDVTIGLGAEGTPYSAFMELVPQECPFSNSDATICGYGPSK